MNTLDISDVEREVAAHAVQRQIAELRDQGFDIEVLEDMGVMAVVRIAGEDGEPPFDVRIDPLDVVGRLQRQRRAALN